MLPTVALVVSHLAWLVHCIYFVFLGLGKNRFDDICSEIEGLGEICQSASSLFYGAEPEVEAWKLLHPSLMMWGGFQAQIFLAAASLIFLAFILVRTPTSEPATSPLYLPPVC